MDNGQIGELPFNVTSKLEHFQQLREGTSVTFKTTTPFQQARNTSDLYHAHELLHAKAAGTRVMDAYSVVQALHAASLADISYVDDVHFRPFVYEQLNDALLNQLCP